jgi:phage terminase Nu1 subunit (DNA packaging protein)
MGVAKNAIPFHALREKDIAEAFMITPRQVRNWVKDGCPINKDRSYSHYQVLQWYVDRETAKYKGAADGSGGLENQKTLKEIELLAGKIEKQNIEVDELKKNTVSKYLYNRAITTIIEAFTKFFVDVLKRNVIKLRAVPDDQLPSVIDDLGIQATKHMVQSVKIVEQREE